MRNRILGLLDSKFGPIVFALSLSNSKLVAVLFEPYIDKDGKLTCGVTGTYERMKKSITIVRSIPYDVHVEIHLKDEGWVVANHYISRVDKKDIRPSDSAIETIKAELTKVWLNYISQHPEFLAEVKIGSLENRREELQEKNTSLRQEIEGNEDKIKDIDFALAAANRIYSLKYPTAARLATAIGL